MDALFTRTIKAGKSTFFIDVKESKNNQRYISLAESSISGEGEERKFTRKSILMFDNVAEQVCDALLEATGALRQ
jgi:hypothetical protein